MYQFATTQETSTAKLPASFQKFQNTLRAPTFTETKLIPHNVYFRSFCIKSKKSIKIWRKKTIFGLPE